MSNGLVKKQTGELTDPRAEVMFASKAAKALQSIVESKKNKVVINGKQYLQFEDWQTLARFFHYTAGIDKTKPIEKDGILYGYEARAVVYNEKGKVIGSAEASCMRDESNWKTKPEFQLKSMAQTRASAKALRNILAWVSVLAGYEGTPAEEMDDKVVEDVRGVITPTRGHVEAPSNGNKGVKAENVGEPATNAQIQAIYTILAKKLGNKPREEVNAGILETYKVDMTKITMGQASDLITALQGE